LVRSQILGAHHKKNAPLARVPLRQKVGAPCDGSRGRPKYCVGRKDEEKRGQNNFTEGGGRKRPGRQRVKGGRKGLFRDPGSGGPSSTGDFGLRGPSKRRSGLEVHERRSSKKKTWVVLKK